MGFAARPARVAGLAVFAALVSAQAQAQNVSMNGVMGGKALLVIDGRPQMMSAGTTQGGVKLLSVGINESVVEVGGHRVTLGVGGAPVNLGSAVGAQGAQTAGGATEIVLSMGSGGHFSSMGSINGRSVQFLVDTGATAISMSQATADRIGLDYRKGRQVMSQTANGAVPVTLAKLAVVRVGEVQVYDVDAVVIPAQMDFVLLGNTFLSRFQMRRDNDTMTLSRRF